MTLDWQDGALAAGLACYRRHEFFETHEHWEAVWVRSAEPEKRFLQGLIHIAVGFHHLQHGNKTGASRQLKRALQKLNPFPSEFENVPVEQVRASLRAWLQALEQTADPPDLPHPPI